MKLHCFVGAQRLALLSADTFGNVNKLYRSVLELLSAMVIG